MSGLIRGGEGLWIGHRQNGNVVQTSGLPKLTASKGCNMTLYSCMMVQLTTMSVVATDTKAMSPPEDD